MTQSTLCCMTSFGHNKHQTTSDQPNALQGEREILVTFFQHTPIPHMQSKVEFTLEKIVREIHSLESGGARGGEEEELLDN